MNFLPSLENFAKAVFKQLPYATLTWIPMPIPVHVDRPQRRCLPPKALKIYLVRFALCSIVIVAGGGVFQLLAAQIQSPAPTQSAGRSAGSPSPRPTIEVAKDWNKTIDSAQKLIAALAIIIGGFWAWLKFFRGRTFRSRLELTVSSNLIMKGPTKFLRATMEMKNVGLSQVKLKGDAIYLDVFLIDASTVRPAPLLYSAKWSAPITFPVFQDHGWIEPAEEISDELLFQLPEREQLACKLKLTVNSRGNSWILFKTEGTRWSATTIGDCQPPKEANESAAHKKGEEV